MKKFKVSYSYPLEHPIKVVVQNLGLSGLLGWLFQKYGSRTRGSEVIVTERIVELPALHQWLGRVFKKPEGEILEVGHFASSASLELASLGYTVTAIDLRSYPFTHTNLKSFSGDFLKYDFAKKFDCVFSLSTIEHFGFSGRYGGKDSFMDNSDEQALEKISDLLKPKGCAIISVPYAKTWVSGIWFRVYTRSDLERKLSSYFNVLESRFYSRCGQKWLPVGNVSHDPVSPHDGVALFLLSKKAQT